jgi:FAD/FMN-containing dehydrogenase
MTTPLTRRAFLASVTSAALIVGFNPRTRSWITRAHAAQPGWDQLPKLDGALLLDETSRNALASDGGQYFHRVPLAVLRPLSTEDIVKTVQFANTHALKVAVRGQGHSQYGQTLVEGGIVIDSSTLNAVKMAGSGAVDTQAGAT